MATSLMRKVANNIPDTAERNMGAEKFEEAIFWFYTALRRAQENDE